MSASEPANWLGLSSALPPGRPGLLLLANLPFKTILTTSPPLYLHHRGRALRQAGARAAQRGLPLDPRIRARQAFPTTIDDR
ncbi:MAG: hypothetical protein H6646_09000 [Anaerolineales bacterium]|nr:hypothetical protein [Anaerolineales bacterium]